MTKRILFVCTGNIARSPTAEKLFTGREKFEVISAGTWIRARKKVTINLIDWSDIIFVMENYHKKAILNLKPTAKNKIIVLNISDRYFRDDPELIKILKLKLLEYLKINW